MAAPSDCSMMTAAHAHLGGDASNVGGSSRRCENETDDSVAGIGLFQDRDNLGFAKSYSFHENLLGHSARKLYELSVL